jgi:hypothetical protein
MSRNITLNEVKPPFKIQKEKIEGIIKYDIDNAYPTRIERIIDGSTTARASAGMLKRFLVGEGFENEALNQVIVGKDRFGRDTTLYHALGKAARSISYYHGFYFRLQFNGDLKVSGMRAEQFKDCRFGEMDSQDNAGKIVVYNNWDKEREKRIYKEKYNRVDIYNTNERAIKAQIAAAGGFEKWKGQIFFWFEDDEYIYPVSPIDPALYDADTEKQISLFKNGELRRGFFMKYIIHHTNFDNPQDAIEFKEAIKKMMGGGHEYSSMVLEGEFDENGKLKEGPNINVEKIEQNINDKIFETYEKSTINQIRKAYYAIPQILIDYEDGKLGTTSGEALRQACDFYNSQIADLRKNLSQCFAEIMKNWHVDIGETNFNIKPLQLGTALDIQRTADNSQDQ